MVLEERAENHVYYAKLATKKLSPVKCPSIIRLALYQPPTSYQASLSMKPHYHDALRLINSIICRMDECGAVDNLINYTWPELKPYGTLPLISFYE
jgi:hypothetical protein